MRIRWPHVSPQTIRSVLTGAGIALILVFSAFALVVSILNGIEDRSSREELRALEIIQTEHEEQTKQRIEATEQSIAAIERTIARLLRRHDAQTEAMLEDLLTRFRALRFEIIEPTPEGRETIIIQPQPESTRPGKRKGQL